MPRPRVGDARRCAQVPVIDGEEYELEVEPNEKAGVKGATLSLKDLKEKFPRVEVSALPPS